MNGEIYLRLLNAINELKRDIEDTNPSLNHEDLDREIYELYEMVNSYKPE